MGELSRTLPGTNFGRKTGIRTQGFSNQRLEKPNETNENFRISRLDMGSNFRENVSSYQASTGGNKDCEVGNEKVRHYQERISDSSGKVEFCDSRGPPKQVLGKRLVQISENFSEKSKNASPSEASKQHVPMAKKSTSRSGNSHECTGTRSRSLHGRLRPRVGLPYFRRTPEEGKMAFHTHQASQQSKRTNHSLYCFERDTSASELTHSIQFGQQHDGLCDQKARFFQVVHHKWMGSFHSVTRSKEKHLDLNDSYSRPVQRPGGLLIQGGTNSNRVEARSKNIQGSISNHAGSRDRPICDSRKCPTSEFRLPLQGSYGIRDKCNDPELESMVQDLHLPSSSDQTYTRNFEEIANLSRASSPSSSILANISVVSETDVDLQIDTTEITESFPDHPGQNIGVHNIPGQKPSGLELLRKHFGSKYGSEVAEIITKDSRASTLRQYEAVFRLFAKFVTNTGDTQITEKTFLDFFFHCHQVLGRRSTTIYSYRSALKRIAVHIFKINLYSDEFESFLKGIRLKEKPKPVPQISWCLDKVLQTLQNISGDSKYFNGKCAFLIQLAMGCRISELAAVSREAPSTKFLPGGQLRITSDPKLLERHTGSGLKKHERFEKLDRPLIIHPLFLSDGVTPSSLCPIKNTRDYILKRPSSDPSGQLFVHHKTGKPLTISQLRTSIVSVIKHACPDSFPKTHDIRKAAASLSLMSSMGLDEIASKTGWSQSKTFWTHYNISIRKLTTDCISMGNASLSSLRGRR